MMLASRELQQIWHMFSMLQNTLNRRLVPRQNEAHHEFVTEHISPQYRQKILEEI